MLPKVTACAFARTMGMPAAIGAPSGTGAMLAGRRRYPAHGRCRGSDVDPPARPNRKNNSF